MVDTNVQGFHLSVQQKRIWQLSPGTGAYYVQGWVETRQPLDPDRLRAALAAAVARYAILRTGYQGRAELQFPLQVIHEEVSYRLEVIDLTAETEAVRQREMEQRLHDDLLRTPDLAAPGGLRALLFQLAPGRQRLAVRLPALAADAYALFRLIDQLLAYCRQPVDAAEETIQYVQFAQWQDDLLDSGEELATHFWAHYDFSGYRHLRLPLAAPGLGSGKAGRPREAALPPAPAPAGAVEALARQLGIQVATVYLACLKLLVYKHTGNGNVVTGLVHHGREYEELQDVIGVVSGCLPLAHQLQPEQPVDAWLRRLDGETNAVCQWQRYFAWPAPDAPADAPGGEGNSLPLGFEWLDLSDLPDTVTRAGVQAETEPFGLKLRCLRGADGLSVAFYGRPDRYTPAAAALLAEQYGEIVRRVVAAPAGKVGAVSMLTPGQVRTITDVFNAPVAAASPSTVLDLFRSHAARTPDGPAVRYGDQTVSYRELDELSGRFANYLRGAFGFGAGDAAGVALPRSEWMLVALLGIFKAGGAFVPLDPDHPATRLSYIATDSGCKLVIAGEAGRAALAPLLAVPVVAAEPAVLGAYPAQSATPPPAAGSLAYILYTSGSTGTPKGCPVEHGSLANYITWANGYYLAHGRAAHLGVFSPLTFDFTLTSVFCPLASGGTVRVYPQAWELTQVLPHLFGPESRCNLAKLTPAHVSLLEHLPLPATPLSGVIVGGEALTARQVAILRRLNPALAVYNEYGPTEATVGCVVKKVEDGEAILIGRPIANARILILDERNGLCAIGEAGEIGIGGTGLARGYLHQDALTASTFIAGPGGRLYKSGDLGRWLPDGNLEYIGRRDNQVKIRGYRVELGEVEAALLACGGVKEAVVVVRPDRQGDPSLVGYYVAAAPVPYDRLRRELEEKLPAYLIPAHCVELDAMPLTPNGKLDRGRLPDPDARREAVLVAPRNPVEKELAEVFAKVLGKPAVGVTDNFMQSGGDSIKAIQIVARLSGMGYTLRVTDLFRHPSVAALAEKVVRTGGVTGQETVTGEVPLVPIQMEVFPRNKIDPHHYNQSCVVYRRAGFDAGALRAVIAKLQAHHDVLRSVFAFAGGAWRQTILGLEYPVSVREFDVTGRPDAAEAAEALAETLQAGKDLFRGPMLEAGLFRMDDGDYLLLSLHHMVSDGISWGILLEDLETLCGQYQRGEALQLPPKTDSFKAWSERLRAYADGPLLLAEKEYWKELLTQPVPRIPEDYPVAVNYLKDRANCSLRLSPADTQALIARGPVVFGAEMNDLILTALAMGVAECYGHDAVLLTMEGHGREDLPGGINISRTVGWFTSSYPILLDVSYRGDLRRQVQVVRDYMRRVPNKGVGYGVLKYLTRPENKQDLDFGLTPQISFNYMGHSGKASPEAFFEVAPVFGGNGMSPNTQSVYHLDVGAGIFVDALSLTVSYNRHQFSPLTVSQVRDGCFRAFRAMAALCGAPAGSDPEDAAAAPAGAAPRSFNALQ